MEPINVDALSSLDTCNQLIEENKYSFIDVLALSQNQKLISILSWTEGVVTFLVKNEEMLSKLLGNSLQNLLPVTYDAENKKYTHTLIKYTNKREAIFTKGDSLETESVTIFENPILGRGSYGIVYYGKYLNKSVAVKELREHFEPSKASELEKEFQILMILKHPNIVSCFGYSLQSKNPFLVMEHMSGGNLYNWIHNQDKDIEISKILKIASEIAQGMNYLHTRQSEKVIHRDLKSSNILFDHNFSVKIADFGQSKTICSVAKSNTTQEMFGTTAWAAPEYLDARRIQERNEKGDIFSFGVILWELVTREEPWKKYGLLDIVTIVTGGGRLKIPERCPLKTIINSCWHNDPNRRSSFKQLIEDMNAKSNEEQTPQPQMTWSNLVKGLSGPDDCASFYHYVNHLHKCAARFSHLVDKTHLPLAQFPEPTVATELCATLTICAGAKSRVSGAEYYFCQALYLVAIMAAGGVLDETQVRLLKGSDNNTVLFLNKLTERDSWRNFGNLNQLYQIVNQINQSKGHQMKYSN